MWTPRRIMLLVVGAGLTLACYLVYDHFLGWINGLPALPERFLVAARPDGEPIQVRNDDRIKRLLRQAFGDNCPEVRYIYQLELRAQGLILATEHHAIEDGRVKLSPFSLAVIGKVNPRTGVPEIYTVHCDSATITFDRRIETLSDMTGSKMIAAQFDCDRTLGGNDPRAGFIHVTHNHGTAQPDDDLTAQAVGPVLFEDTAATQPNRPQLWTNRPVQIIDRQSRPPHRISAETFSVYLQPDALKGGDRPRSNERSSGVRLVELGNVHMLLAIDQSSDFLTSPAAAKPAAERPVLSIRTQGAFRFDVTANRAEFTVPKNSAGLRHHVEVVRTQAQGADELRCERLEVQFQRRPTAGRPSAEPLTIDEVRASGAQVTIASAAEKLRAHGTELIFRQSQREAVLRGSPMSAIKEGNRIEAPELFLHRPDPQAPVNPAFPVVLARAMGPGTVWLHDAQQKRRGEVRWRGELVIDREGGNDRITLDGGAVFEDRGNAQWLRGDQIRIWTEPGPADPRSSAGSSPARPRKMQVSGRVEGRTPEMQVDNTPVLVVWFQDAPRLLRPAASVTPAPAPAPPKPAIVPASASSSPPRTRLGPPVDELPSNEPPARKPVKVSSEYVEAILRRAGNDVELDRVGCRGEVYVRQDPDKPGERGLDVRADALNLTHVPEGDVLTLSGGRGEPARIEVQEMTLRGPTIVFDQRNNRVNVNGAGRVTLITSTDLNGEKLPRPVEVHISWEGKMDFVGNRVSFRGGVLAEQESVRVRERLPEREVNRLTCPKMDVYLDRAVSFSSWHRAQTAATRGAADERPKVKKVVCHPGGPDETGQVIVTNHCWRESKLIRFQLVEAPEATLDNETGEVTAIGKGEMRLFQLGDPVGPKESQPKTAQEFTLTRVTFKERMRANNRAQTVTFTRDVLVTHTPTDDPNLHINLDNLPPRSFKLTCRTLEVTSHNQGGRRYATMMAEGKADIYAHEFAGRADVIKYDESKMQQVIFDSYDGSNPAVLFHIKNKGEPPKELMGKTILYYRQTNECRVSGGLLITGSQ